MNSKETLVAEENPPASELHDRVCHARGRRHLTLAMDLRETLAAEEDSSCGGMA